MIAVKKLQRLSPTFKLFTFKLRFYADDSAKKKCVPPKMACMTGGKSDVCVYSPPPSTLQETCKPAPKHPEAIALEDLPLPSPLSANVVVIGAGISGLTAAQKLIKEGITNTIVLEASSRPGGRIRSAHMGDTVVELGPFCEFPKKVYEMPIVDAAVKLGLIKLGPTDPTKGLLVNSDGTQLPTPISFMAFKELAEMLEEAKRLRSSTDASEEMMINHYIGIKMHQVLKRIPPESAETATRALVGLSSYLVEHQVISDGVGAYTVVPGGIKVPLGGVGRLSQLIADVGDHILYNKRVDKIKYGTVTHDQKPRAIVRCTDGTQYQADCVLVTLPLGVLKEEWESMFSPHLPAHKLAALVSLEYNVKEKIYVEWSQPLWVWRDTPLNRKFKGCELKGRSDWTKNMSSIKEVPGSQRLLQFIIKGGDSKEMIRSSDADVLNAILQFLKDWLGDESIPMPKSLMRSNWGDNPLFRGSYTTSKNENEERVLAEALPRTSCDGYPILYFAGEATSQGLCGTLQGAILSGIREADKIISGIKRNANYSQHPCSSVTTGICAN
ncbi:peroxisomal N(1)-acetyl-spermine/spermidine oxidase-like [Cimex lectularius]|uniref:Amine oxidase domain-containing protein n=1 Tax=Cimex lectularius TaxID=79782 RepID=A0A8I6R647_CIMLE|nr:peroxisomal N(1)-acetyl-spermine/spermidine oxidase-like [Cimex lectularius]